MNDLTTKLRAVIIQNVNCNVATENLHNVILHSDNLQLLSNLTSRFQKLRKLFAWHLTTNCTRLSV